MLGKIFDLFVKASPVSVMAQGLMERILHPERLDACFDGLESAQYTRELLFSSVFNRMSQREYCLSILAGAPSLPPDFYVP
jgi:hypothetical protein